MMNREDRQRVRTCLNVNMVVEAGAGTGKTTLLIDRLCFALLAQGILAPRLVALTFTEKAAAEIKNRLVFKLQAVLQAARAGTQEPTLDTLISFFGVPVQEIITRAETALSQLDISPIGTIHGFCADILRAYPLEAGLNPGAEIDKGARSQRLFEAEWNRFLDSELGENAPRATQWKEVLSSVTLADLRACAEEMCSGKTEGYDYFAQKELLIKICTRRADEAKALADHFAEGKKSPRVIEKALFQAAERFAQAAAWLQTGVYTGKAQETIQIKSVPKDWDEQSADEAKALCRFAAQADPAVQLFVRKAYDLLSPLVQAVRARLKQEGVLSFDDLIVKTRDLLKNNLLVRRYVQEDYDALYIDEFQDTDPVQGELLLFLAEQKGGGATDWREVKLQPGKLFVVGDPKQSIYRFRGADITAYELFTDLILSQGGEKAYLRENFRSEQEIIALANGVCAVVMKERPAFQPAYEPIFTAKTARSGAAELALVCRAEGEKISADDYRHNQGRFVARWIRQNVGRLTLPNGEKLQYKDIAILSRAATTIGPYADALRREGIAFSVEEDRDFYRRQEICDFLNFLRAADDPQDRIALTGVLRSPLGAMTDEEIYRLSTQGRLDWRTPSADPKAKRAFARLRQFAARAGREPLRVLLRSLLNETFLPEACAYAYDGERSIANLEKLVSLAEGYSLQTPLTLGQFLSRVQEMMEQELGRLTALPEGEALNAVTMMTVHKSKGLQFPVVIWTDISKKESASAAQRPQHLYSWRYNLHGFRVGAYGDINLAWLEEEQRQHARCEEVRVLYVALTRAKYKLLAVGNEESDSRTVADMFARAGYFPPQGQRLPTLGKEQELQVQYVPYQKPSEFIYQHRAEEALAAAPRDFDGWKKAYAARMQNYRQMCRQKGVLAPSALAEQQDFSRAAADLGTLVHAALAHYFAGQKEAAACLRAAAAETGLGACVPAAQNLLDVFISSALCKRLQTWQSLASEMPFSMQTAQGMVSGVMDWLARDEQGRLWVLDFKTDQTDDVAQMAQKYAEQMQAYVQAARQIYPQETVRAGLVLVRAAKLQELA